MSLLTRTFPRKTRMTLWFPRKTRIVIWFIRSSFVRRIVVVGKFCPRKTRIGSSCPPHIALLPVVCKLCPRKTRIWSSCPPGAAAASVHTVFLFCLEMRRALACHIVAQSSIACRCSSLCPLAVCAIQQAKSTMASHPHIYLDPSQPLVSSIHLHNMQHVAPCDWSALFDKAIAHDDLRVLLVTSIGLLRDKHKIIAHPTNFTKWTREFVCPTCTQFRLIFTCSKPQTRLASNCWLLALQEPGHSAECPTSSCVDHGSVLANLQ
jgi:hypothetical protein